MWKPIGYISTILLLLFSLTALGILAWYYDQFDFKDSDRFDDQGKDYINTTRAVLACDLFFFIVCFLGLFFLIKPNAGAAKFYCVVIVLLVIFKIIAGALLYSGVNDEGKKLNDIWQAAWDVCSAFSCNAPDQLKAWHTERGYEIASIIIMSILGLLSACGVLKVSSG